MMRMIERRTLTDDIVARVIDDGPLTVAEVAARLGTEAAMVHTELSSLMSKGYVTRDEFGRYATWSSWPRAGV